MKCEKCKYFKLIGGVGFCRRYPPIQSGGGVATVDNPPTVYKGGWCGEYKKGTKK